MLSERSQTQKHILYDSICMTSWKRENHREENRSVVARVGGGLRKQHEGFLGGMVDIF